MDIGIPQLLEIIALKEVDLYAARKALAEREQAFADLEARLVALETSPETCANTSCYHGDIRDAVAAYEAEVP